MGPFDLDSVAASTSTDSFWESLTSSLLGSGQKFFSNQQNINASITKQNITARTVTSVVQFVAIVLVIGGIIKALLSRR